MKSQEEQEKINDDTRMEFLQFINTPASKINDELIKSFGDWIKDKSKTDEGYLLQPLKNMLHL